MHLSITGLARLRTPAAALTAMHPTQTAPTFGCVIGAWLPNANHAGLAHTGYRKTRTVALNVARAQE